MAHQQLGGRNFFLQSRDAIQYKLLTYERAKDATFLLELALWKSKIDESSVGTRSQRRSIVELT
jgi:hypothetical protein